MSIPFNLGDPVIYTDLRGRENTGLITGTYDTLNHDGIAKGHVPPLSSHRHAHLVVFPPVIANPTDEQQAEALAGADELGVTPTAPVFSPVRPEFDVQYNNKMTPDLGFEPGTFRTA